MIQQEAYWKQFYGKLKVKVYAPKAYYREDIKKDEYSDNIRKGKHSDNSQYFLEDSYTTFEQILHQGFKANLIVVVPKSSLPNRYSQTMLTIAKKLSDKFDVRNENIIIKAKESKKSALLSSAEKRYRAVHDTLELNRQLQGEQCILLLDDTRATGITILECAKILKDGGATEVVALCFGINESRVGYV